MEARARTASGSAGAEAQHAAGRLTARERIEMLLDPGSFRPSDVPGRGRAPASPAAPDFCCGQGKVHGRPTAVYAYGGLVWKRSFAATHTSTLCAVIERATRHGTPLVGVLDIPGIRIEAGPAALADYARVLAALARAEGAAPRIALVAGPCNGAGALAAPLADFTFVVRGSAELSLSGPEVARAVAQEAITGEQLGGADVHATRSGLADRAFDNEVEALLWARRLLGFLPASHRSGLAVLPTADPPNRREPALERLLGGNLVQTGMRDVVLKVVDEADLYELGAEFAPNLLTGLARIAGTPVGVVANQPAFLAGCLDRAALGKAARFVRRCVRLAIPLLVFVDAPGFLPGSTEEHGGIARAAGDLVQAFAHAEVPVVRVVPRRAWAGAALVMGLGCAGVTLAWRGAEIGLLGAAAIKELSRADTTGPFHAAAAPASPRSQSHELRAARRAGLVDIVIPPARTREYVCRALSRRHGSDGVSGSAPW